MEHRHDVLPARQRSLSVLVRAVPPFLACSFCCPQEECLLSSLLLFPAIITPNSLLPNEGKVLQPGCHNNVDVKKDVI